MEEWPFGYNIQNLNLNKIQLNFWGFSPSVQSSFFNDKNLCAGFLVPFSEPKWNKTEFAWENYEQRHTVEAFHLTFFKNYVVRKHCLVIINLFQFIIILPHVKYEQYMNRFFYELSQKLIENEEIIDHCDSVKQHRANVRISLVIPTRQRFRQQLVTHAIAAEHQIFAISRLIVQKEISHTPSSKCSSICFEGWY